MMNNSLILESRTHSFKSIALKNGAIHQEFPAHSGSASLAPEVLFHSAVIFAPHSLPVVPSAQTMISPPVYG
jgi:hypothetical protein